MRFPLSAMRRLGGVINEIEDVDLANEALVA
jgi:hypothetical protein